MSPTHRPLTVFPLVLAPILGIGCGPTLSVSVRTETALAPGNTGPLALSGKVVFQTVVLASY
jgi:hypothetical protein